MSSTNITKYSQTIIQEYNSVDLLALLGAINLLFENQNKNNVTSYYSSFILLNQNNNKPKASRKTLAKLVDEMNNCGLIYPIQDPPEAPFFQKIIFDKEYVVFNGVDQHAAFYVSRLCEFLLYNQDFSLNKEFLSILKKIVKVVLTISDSVFKKTRYDYNKIAEYPGDRSIILPPDIEALKGSLFFDRSDFYKLGLSEEDIQRYIVFHRLPYFSISNCLDKPIPFYYSRPFLDCGDRILLIDPTSINTYIRYISLELAEKYQITNVFIGKINDLFFQWGIWQTRKSIYATPKYEGLFSHLVYTNNDNYKEIIIPFSKNKLILLSACFNNNLEGKQKTINLNTPHSSIQKQLSLINDNFEVININLLFTYGGDLRVTNPLVFSKNTITLSFDEFESFVINEKKKPCAIFDIAEHITNTRDLYPPLSTDILKIAFLHSLNNDFYLDDDVDAYSNTLLLGFEYIYRYRCLAAKEEVSYVAPFHSRFLLLEKDNDNLYYLSNRFFNDYKIITYNRHQFGGFWVYSDIVDPDLLSFIGTINYWLTSMVDLLKNVVKKQYYIEVINNEKAQPIVMINDTCVVNVWPMIKSISDAEQFDEITFMKEILSNCGLLIPSVEQRLNKDSLNGSKRYNNFVRSDQIMLVPFNKLLKPLIVNNYQSNLLDDYIGRNIAIKKYDTIPGHNINSPDRFLKDTVQELFQELDSKAKSFDWHSSVVFMYEYQEDYLQKLLINKKSLKAKHSLYKSHIKEINAIYYDLNSASPCIRFLIQYFATMQYDGTKEMDERDLELLITTVSKIIHLANIDDGIVYGLLPDEMFLLKSKRITMDLTNLEKFNQFIASEMINDLIDDNINFHNFESWHFSDELNEAYFEEYGFTFAQMSQVIALLVIIGEEQKQEIKTARISDIEKKILNNNLITAVDIDTLHKIINHLSIIKRKTFFDKTIANYRELYPWRLNRTESITRKPLIQFDDKVSWGNRTLYQCFVFVLEHIYNGSEPTKNHSSSKLKMLNGKVLQSKGEKFNDFAFDYLSSNIPELKFYKYVKSFNNKRICDDNGNFLGDIDILGIDKNKQRIYLIEVKDYQYSKNMADFSFERDEFLGKGKKKGFVEKEINRVKWVKTHIEDVKNKFKLKGDNWKVLYTFLSDKPLLCSIFGDLPFNNVAISKINKKYLNSLADTIKV